MEGWSNVGDIRAWGGKEGWRGDGDIGAGPGRRRTLGEPAEEDTSGGTTGEGWTGEGLGEKGHQVLYSPGLAHAHGHMDMAHGTRELCNKSQMSLLMSRPGRRTPEQS